MNIDKKTLVYACIILAVLAMAFAVTPMQIKHILVVNKKVKELRDTISKTQEDVSERPKILADTEKVKTSVIGLQSKIIGMQEVSSLQTYISQAAKENNLEIVETASAPPTVYKKIGTTSFVQIPINVTAKGGFHNLGNFIAKIESGEYCLEVKRLAISYAKPQLNITLTIVAIAHG
jgi:Tfp pilus assembly protein PilO